ncbi:MAG: hypothetical protein HY530_00055 [Chloroflexi bacterium]|nr:hypothetical protein [Chloroflexota bacterium]
MLNESLLRSTHFSALVQFPPLPKFGDTQLQELYVEIKKHHDFSSFTAIQNGARIYSEEVRDCIIARDRIQLSENIQTSFPLVKDNFCDILKTIKERLQIQIYFNMQYRLRALWELEGGYDSFNMIQDKLLKLSSQQLSLLGIAPKDAGVRIVCPQLPQKVHDFKIESFLRNHKYLFIDLGSSFLLPAETASILETQMQECYNFIFENIKRLLQSIT